MNDLSHRPGRGGITINDRGDEAPIGFWPEKFDGSPTGWTGQLRNQFGETVRIAQRHHEKNRTVILAKAARKPVVLPEPDVRTKLARNEQRKLDEIERHVAKITGEAFDARAKLRPFDYGDGIADFMRRQELRATLKGATDKERAVLLKKYSYRAAALELEPEQTGLPQSHFDNLREAELQRKFPDILAGTAEAFEAAEIVSQAIKTSRRAVEAELLAAGATVAEPAAAPEPAKAWA